MRGMAGIRQFNEDAALERMMEVFWQRGYGATSMQDLAQATGILRGSLYNAYGDKQALFLLAYARYQARYLDTVRRTLDDADPAAGLRAFFYYVIDSMSVPARDGADDVAATRGCLTTKTATDEAAMAGPVRDALRGLLAELEDVVCARFERPDAHARLTLTPRAAARLVVTMTRGVAVMQRIDDDAAQLKPVADSLAAVLFPAHQERPGKPERKKTR